MASYRTIVVGTDGSPSSFRAVTSAASLAAATGATLILACAYAPMRERERSAA
ncbi:universal stress protein, partial [Streptosporangium canum]